MPSQYSLPTLVLLYVMSIPAYSGDSESAKLLVYPFLNSSEKITYNIQPIVDLFSLAQLNLSISIGDDYADTLYKGIGSHYDVVIAPAHIAAILMEKYGYEAFLYGKRDVRYYIYTHKKNDHITDLLYLRGGVLVGNDRYAMSTSVAAAALKRDMGYIFNQHYFFQAVGGYEEVIRMLVSNEQQYGVLVEDIDVLTGSNEVNQLKKIYELDFSAHSVILINVNSPIYNDKKISFQSLCEEKDFDALMLEMKNRNGFDMICQYDKPIAEDFIKKYKGMFRIIR